MGINLLEGTQISTNVPQQILDSYKAAKAAPNKIVTWLDHNVQIHMLDMTVTEQFYMKKRNFQFVIVDEAFDRHSNKTANQNKFL